MRFVSPYYRDDSMLLVNGFYPYELMLQLLAKSRWILLAVAVTTTATPAARLLKTHVSFIKAALPACRLFPPRALPQGFNIWSQKHLSQLKKGVQGEAPIVVCSFGDER